jgi:hypothetical protein
MRFFVLILSLVILFQPTSWAAGLPMTHAHQHMDKEMSMGHSSTESTIHMVAGIEAHCQRIYSGTQTDSLADSSYQQDSHPSVNCHSAPSAVSLPEAVAATSSFQFFDVAYHAPSISFQSRTESPEIRPPHNNIRL